MLIKVKVFPSSKKENILQKNKDSFEIKTKEKPEQGRATKRVITMLSMHFNLPESKIRLIRGAKTRNKIFDIIDVI
ncbi:MAG: DUF167 domain-containing protein [Patescibacteria group bacterium]|nr:DUF167 domain-containing protein [Patescibacteria group bacterium]MDD5164848.1 DUF167 domain-containing protein [Patescibacteria group bacterium]MDD5534680.1 DUF167 domain-containing protein [Patescibacteria group bacterium]